MKSLTRSLGKCRRWYEPDCGVDAANIEGDGAAVLGGVLNQLTSLFQIPIRGETFYSRALGQQCRASVAVMLTKLR